MFLVSVLPRWCRYRLYRDACMALEGNYLKDLNVLGRDLSKVAIVDNSPYAYGFQVYMMYGTDGMILLVNIARTKCDRCRYYG